MAGAAVNVQTAPRTPAGLSPRVHPAVTPPRPTEAVAARSGWLALFVGLRRGLHPPLLLAWMVLLWLPAAVAALPAALWLYLEIGHAPPATGTAATTSVAFLAQAVDAMRTDGVLLAACAGFAMLLSALLSPWLAGMVVAQIRTGQRPGFGATLRAGLREYPRLLRMLGWSLLLVAVAASAGVAAKLSFESFALRYVTDEAASLAAPLGWFVPLLCVLFVHVTVEAGRAWLGADPALKSVLVAWRRGLQLLRQRPGPTLLVYAGASLAGGGLALACLRLRTLAELDGWPAWGLDLACAQLAVLSLAWARSARLHALADLAAHAQGPARVARVPHRPHREAAQDTA
ncbi:hypothetical protein ACFPN1_11010 [Lysobacter yangpyeongensis]|uniref:Glycerophosphoryl diester phosphodiesterase membrane domain-containing protein n=1 Tax=Lysobacter yangpyeongensis TaxID=346182 RepID=A0ABW0SN89_9GAMM